MKPVMFLSFQKMEEIKCDYEYKLLDTKSPEKKTAVLLKIQFYYFYTQYYTFSTVSRKDPIFVPHSHF